MIMSLFSRLWTLIRANLNHWLSRMEDPEKILEQAVQEMQDQLVMNRQAVAQAIATQKRTERQATQAQNMAQEWYQRAQLALQKGDEALARQALTRRQSYLETATAMQAQLSQQSDVVAQLKKNLQALEAKLVDAKTKKDLYIARARSAQASLQLNGLLDRTGSSEAMKAFERMEEKVMQLEAQAEVTAELSTDALEQRFAQLGHAGEVESELVKLKTQLGGSTPEQLPAAAGGAIDPELEKIREELRRIG
jgi:phage shock protein A